eukprot:CAMPEP_0206361480 /NCGR_PEP_ID=MMETSP0294-20121207/385_1 /ASSEMBLY_ACC=CAM_ASM_000327 /TAXON_ID=39354 /ORGANISM="Heterosigma akashiwo, Strain CCMP2393" /LENGTH=121 /DNA_ID=CAMNT_0053806369 /DNA_START=374 /DNA_END=736 /DNA_ORIENTATION=+
MTALGPWIKVHFLGSSLTFMMVYIWGRKNEHVRMNFLGVIPFTAPYLPWVLLGFSCLLGNPPTADAVGIGVGHCYFFARWVYPEVARLRYPEVARLRGWRLRALLTTPGYLHRIFGSSPPE